MYFDERIDAILLVVFTPTYTPFGRSFAKKVDNFDTIGIETIDLILFVKMLDLQGVSALWQNWVSFIVGVQRCVFTPSDTHFLFVRHSR